MLQSQFNGGAVGLSIEPAFDYYFNEVFDGFHLGLAAGVGLALSGGGPVAIPIQANIGYNIAVGDNFRIDIFAMPGVAIAGGAVTFGVTPGACFGYKF